tara:strand:- start:3660 stop:4031 length:372 start_codon:yes stop_codon:yes gene_type:complete
MEALATILLLLLLTNPTQAAHKHKEAYYQKIDCDKKKGITEYKLPNSKRVDCLTKHKAIEHDWAVGKNYECLGQALYYSMMTKKKGVCSLILEKAGHMRYVNDIRKTIDYHNLDIELETIRGY